MTGKPGSWESVKTFWRNRFGWQLCCREERWGQRSNNKAAKANFNYNIFSRIIITKNSVYPPTLNHLKLWYLKASFAQVCSVVINSCYRPLTLMKRLTFPSLLASRKLMSSTFIGLFKLFRLFVSVRVPFTPWTAASLGLVVVMATIFSWAGVWSSDAPAEGDGGCGPPTNTA